MKSKTYLAGNYAFKTDIGKVRLNNEDRAIALTNIKGNILLIVCDGMGGSNKGEYAASIAVKMISDSFKKKQKFFSKLQAISWARKQIYDANKEIYNESYRNRAYEGMGTTITLALILWDTLVVINAGDSRLYEIKNRKLEQITEDQTYVGYLYRTGKITQEEAKTHPKRHMLMNALGINPVVSMDVKILPYNNETILVCSDGLYNNVSEKDIEAILKSDDSPEQKVNELISLSNANGGSDNIATIVWEAKN